MVVTELLAQSYQHSVNPSEDIWAVIILSSAMMTHTITSPTPKAVVVVVVVGVAHFNMAILESNTAAAS